MCESDVQNKGLENQIVEVTLQVKDAVMEAGFSLTSHMDYPLTIVDYYHLKSPQRRFDLLSSSVFFIGFGLLLTSVGRFIAQQLGYATKLEPYEVVTGFVAIGIACICYFIGLYIVPNPKKELLKRIDEHFTSNPPSRSTIKAKDK